MRHLLAAIALASCLPVQRSPVVAIQDVDGNVTCSAFAVSGVGLVTAAHCVHGDSVDYVTQAPWLRRTRRARVLLVNPERDWAVIELAPDVPALQAGPVGAGDRVTVVPALADWQTAAGAVATSYYTGTDATGRDHLRWETTITVEPGWSGSPVLNARGEAVGILVGCHGQAVWAGDHIAKSCTPRNSTFVELPR